MSEFFQQAQQIQMSIRKIESDTQVLHENYNDRLVKINPADKRSKMLQWFYENFLRERIGLDPE